MRVAPDDTLLVDDFSTGGAALWQFQPDFGNSNLVLSGIGMAAGQTAKVHGDMFGTPLMTGSLAEGNLVLWTADGNLAVPGSATMGPGTFEGAYNCVFRYDIGAGPLPWSQPPNYAYTMGLSGINGLRTEVELGKDGKIIVGFGRANYSNPDIQILDPTGTTLLYSSGVYPPANTGPTPVAGGDPWNGIYGSGVAGGTYAGVRVSPDGGYLASVDINNGVTIASLTNGTPDDSSIFGISAGTLGSTTGLNLANSRGMDWDAANNLYVTSSGQGLMRIYSLGLSMTCITSNDWTGTNGTFQMVLPPVTARIAAPQPLASQNYINNSPPGTPIPGVFTISLDRSTLDAPVQVNFTRTGTAGLTNNYNFNYGVNADGVIISSNSVTFPAGVWPRAGNWSVALQVIPTATPVSTNTLITTLQISGGANYLAGSPSRATVAIQNTGPQLLLLAAAPVAPAAGGSAATMYRGVTNDYAKFAITRLGDTNGPGNSASSITPLSYTVTNVNYYGTAVYPTDFRAKAQRLDPAGDGALVPPVDGPTAIIINPGDAVVTCAVGSPVRHTNLSATPTNLTIILNLTNAVANKSLEGYDYTVNTAATTLTLIDNAIGPEVVLWSNPLNSEGDSVNWTLTFAGTNLGPGALPIVIPNYANVNPNPGLYDFNATFGYDPAADGIGPSPVMAANGWNRVLKMTVNKNLGAHAGVNVYPQGKNFFGNYALRFNMYLSLYQFGLDNPGIGVSAQEYALFGVNHRGTNCNWRTDGATAVPAGAGMWPTNSDGVWIAIDSGGGPLVTTPAPFDALVPLPVPNNANPSALADRVSNTTLSQNGVFKHPPFDAMNVAVPTVANPGGGEPANKWLDVSLEIRQQTNSLFINRSAVLTPFSNTNGVPNGSYTNGTIMLGYLDPNWTVSDGSAFVYFSNVRVVELSPYILAQPGLASNGTNRLIVPQFSSLTFTSSAALATAPITNTWYRGTGTAGTGIGVPTAALQTNTANATSMNDTLTWTFNNLVDATNYMSVFSDPAGYVTSSVVAVGVVYGPTNRSYAAWATSNLVTVAAGPTVPSPAYQWYFNTVSNFGTATKLANSTHYAGVTASTLWLTNMTSADGGYYWTSVTNNVASGLSMVTPAATLSVLNPPTSITNITLSGTNIVLAFTGTNPLDTSSAFILQSAGVVTGPFTNNPAAIFSGTYPSFQVTAPQTGDTMFYRLLHK